jgi:ParB-like chromosome segregation protein Spo0J
VETLSPEVLEELRNGRSTRERKIAVCSGGAHLHPADRAEILVILAGDSDEMVSARAQEALLSQPVESFVDAIKKGSNSPLLFAYAAKNFADKPGICDAMVQNKNCAAEFLVPVVRHLSTLGIKALLEELDRVSESSTLAAALQQSSRLTDEQKNQLNELRSSSIDQAVLAEAVAEAEPDLAKRQTLLQRLAVMSVAQRVQFAIKGGSEARRTLIRDSNKVVQRAVLQSPRLTDQEVEAFAAMSNLNDEILRLIAGNRNFRKNYSVVRNLLNNPKTPLDVTLHLLPMINVMDLKRLCVNKNIPETLRSTAIKLQRQRQDVKK